VADYSFAQRGSIVLARDCYEILGVSRGASQGAVKRAFREGVLRNHPDRNPNDPVAAQRLRDIIEAYHSIKDPFNRLAPDSDMAMRTSVEYTVSPRIYEDACPVWLTQCVVIVLFFFISFGMFSIAKSVINKRSPVFRPMLNVVKLEAADPIRDMDFSERHFSITIPPTNPPRQSPN
jgi:hypothetical protein